MIVPYFIKYINKNQRYHNETYEKRMTQTLCEILRLEKYEVDHISDGISESAAIESDIHEKMLMQTNRDYDIILK